MSQDPFKQKLKDRKDWTTTEMYKTFHTDIATYPNIDEVMHYPEVQFSEKAAEKYKNKKPAKDFVNTSKKFKDPVRFGDSYKD